MPTPPQPNTTTDEPGDDLRRVDGGAHPGGDAAADERGDLEGDVVVDLDRTLLGHRRVLGEGARAGHAEDAGVALA